MIRMSRGRLAAMAGATAAAMLFPGTAAQAGGYVDVPVVRSGMPAASSLDPDDPVPQIGWRHCGHELCGRYYGRGHEHHEHGREDHLGPQGVHDIIVNCALPGDLVEHEHGRIHVRVFASLQRAIGYAAPYDRILIIPPGRGQTCVGGVEVRKPLTITSAGPEPAVIQADGVPDWTHAGDQRPGDPRHPPEFKPWGNPEQYHQDLAKGWQWRQDRLPDGACLTGFIPLGDTLTVSNIKFIARGGQGVACVRVLAGQVEMQNVVVDSRNVDSRDPARAIDPYAGDYQSWAFNVGESGELILRDSRIETDTSGILAQRAAVELHNVEIDVEEGHNGVGLALDRTDGIVDNSHIIGGSFGALVSAGTHGLRLDHMSISKAYSGLTVFGGEQGKVLADTVSVTDSQYGILVMQRSDTVLQALNIGNVRDTGVVMLGGRVELRGSEIHDAAVGIDTGKGDSVNLDLCARIIRWLFGYEKPLRPQYSDEDNLVGHTVRLTDNRILGVDLGVRVADRTTLVAGGNIIVARKECRIGDGRNVDWERSNVCHD